MTHHLALYTFGIFRRPSADPVNDSFHALNDINLAAVEIAEGFVARSGYDGDPGPASWGQHAYPRFYVQHADAHSPSTLSLWRNLEAPFAFAYTGIHAQALARGRDWFLQPVPPPQKPAWPPYVLWWVTAGHRPDWQQAVARLEALHDRGATPDAFTWKTPFDAAGQPVSLNREAVRRMTQQNQERQAGLG